MPALLAEFEARHPGIRVKAEALPWSSDEQRQFLVINLEGGNPGFDVMMLDCIWVPEFARAGWLLDLTGALAARRDGRALPVRRRAPRAIAGRDWALPWFMNVGLLYYRADLLAKYGLRRSGDLCRDGGGDPPRSRGRAAIPRLEGYVWQGKQYEGLVVNALEGFWAAGTEVLGADGRDVSRPRARGGRASPSCAASSTRG